MEELSNKEFIDFLNYYEDYYEPVYIISRPDPKKSYALINNGFKMLSLDDMCKGCELLKEYTPKTTDAIWYKCDDEEHLILYIIEFKDHDVHFDLNREFDALYNKLKKISKKSLDEYSSQKCIKKNFLKRFESAKSKVVDDIEFDLRLKPIETILVVLPKLYEEYCLNNEDVTKKDLSQYLSNIEKKLYVFVRKGHISSERAVSSILEDNLYNQYERLESANIINFSSIQSGHQFDNFLKKEKLKSNNNL